MEVMSAGMHPARDLGSELKPGLFLNRKGVDIRAQRNDRPPFSFAHLGNYSGL
ncbi:hypothetical protein D3C71_1824060 [compost metagenome]